MILTVNTYLKISTGLPSSSAPNNNYLKPGNTVTITDVVQGTPYNGSDIWYKSADGHTYWSGSFAPPPAGFTPQNYTEKKIEFLADKSQAFLHGNTADESKWKVSWAHVDLGIWKIWKTYNTKGAGVKIAVIDTGANADNNDLKGQINMTLSLGDPPIADITDNDSPDFHGTKSAGIIAANGLNTGTVYGVAPESQLIIYKLSDSDTVDSEINGPTLLYLLRQARNAGADIISMSFEMSNMPDGLDTEIKACTDQNILVVAAAGDEDQSAINNNYPASVDGCISVGAYRLVSNQRAVFTAYSAKSDYLFCLAPGEHILTTGTDSSPAYHNYTSAATPFLAGILALTISYMRSNGMLINVDTIKSYLSASCDRINTQTTKDAIEGYGVVNPGAIIKTTKTTIV